MHENRQRLGLDAVVRALAIAPLGGVGVFAVSEVILRQYSAQDLAIVLMIIGGFSYAAEIVLVLPILLAWPAARQPPLGAAAIWGTMIAWGSQYGPLLISRTRPSLVFGGFEAILGVAGGASGVVYALVVRRSAPKFK